MNTIFVLLVLSLFSHQTLAHKKHSHSHGHSHNNLGAHVHGEVDLAIVSSGKQVAIELKSPGESLIGFEHKPKNPEEESKLKALQESWKTDAFGAFTFSPNPEQCTLAQANLIPEYEGGHSVFHGEALFECENNISEYKLLIALRDKYKKIKKLSIEALPEGKKPLKHILEDKTTMISLSL